MHYSYIVGSHYYYLKEIMAIIDKVEQQRSYARTIEAEFQRTKLPILRTSFKEDLLKEFENLL